MTILEGYHTRAELAAELGVSERTLARYERQPDGLPSLTLGGRKLYSADLVKQWIAQRISYPNPIRSSRQAPQKGGARHG